MAKSRKSKTKSKRRREHSKRPSSHKKTGSRRWKLVAAVFASGLVFCLVLAVGIGPDEELTPQRESQAAPIDKVLDEIVPKDERATEQKVKFLKAKELRLVEHLIEKFPDSEEPWVLMGEVRLRRGQIPLAVDAWEKALEINPKRADVYDRMANVAFETDEFEEAISKWQEALKRDPAFPGANNSIARCLVRLGKYQEGIKAIKEEIEISGETTLSYFLLGRAYQQLRDYEQAKANYEKTIGLNPDHINAYYGLYNVCARLKQMDEAKEYLEKFKRLEETRKKTIRRHDQTMSDVNIFSRGLGRLCAKAHDLYQQSGDGAQVEALLKAAIRLDPENILHMEKLVAFYGANNRVSEAIDLCRKIERVDPENYTCQLNLGELLHRKGRLNEAEKAFEKAIALSPGHYGGYKNLARLYLRTNHKPRCAKELAMRAVKLSPIADNFFVLGWACDVNGDSESAISALRKAIELDPDNKRYRQAYQAINRREAYR